jgi:hypothetical protein
MMGLRQFWGPFWDAARESPWLRFGSLGLVAFTLVGGTVFWVFSLPKGAAFAMLCVAVPLAGFSVYNIASHAWMTQASALAKLQKEVQAASERQPVLEFGPPKLLEHGILRRTQMRGSVETTVGFSGPQHRVVVAQGKIRNWRIPITNRGAAVQGVRIKLVNASPGIEGVSESEEVPLHKVHDDPPLDNYIFEPAFSLSKDETVLIEVVAMDEQKPGVCYLWNINYEDAVQEVKLGGTRTLTLRAYAGDINIEASYRVFRDASSVRLEMEGPL